jgi:hypothetical protein
MEKRLKRIEILLIIFSILTLLNLIIVFLTYQSVTKTVTETETETEIESNEIKKLPNDVTRKLLDETVYKIKTEFNRSNWEGIHNIFGEYAKVQIDLQHIENEFKKLIPITGKIETYAYSHHIYEGEGKGAEWYEIQYKCRFKNGKGTIKVSTRTVEGNSEICGINIFLDEL